jgi:hypothetical protein
MQICAADIEVGVPAAHEQQRGRAVDSDAHRRDPNDGPTRNWRRLAKPIDRLDGDAANRDQQQPRIEQRRQDRSAPVAVSMLVGRLFAGEPSRTPRQEQREDVG